ncbi:PAS domain S-box protein [Halomarina rubra]|uniref:histidine kinase n=1 Tax=Halomarina rubra TaxID=2071873 RepID=A0ABD6AW05_9EURY|nr:PAS domain S-box protein [Halomarina rubra]
MGAAGSTPDAFREQVRSAFSNLDTPHTPLTAAELATRLECPIDTAKQTLVALEDNGELHTKQLDTGTTVWWRPATEQSPTDQYSELEEFGAFVRAVEDYAIFTLNPDGTVASWNEGARRIKGYSEDEIIGQHISTFYTEEDVENGVPTENLDIARENHRAEDEGWRVRNDGSRFWADVVITAIRDDEGTLRGFTKVTRDKTEQRDYERELAQESKQTEKLLRTAPVAIAVQNSYGETVMANQRAQEALGLSEQEFIESPDNAEEWELYDPSGEPVPPEKTPAARVMATGERVLNEELIISPPETEEMHFRINATPVFDADGDLERVITAGEDITELKRRERQLKRRKSELETELSEVFGRISDAFYALDEAGRFTHINDRAAEIFQMSEEELLGRSIWEVFPDVTNSELEERFHAAMETQEATTLELYVEELEMWIELNAYPSESGLSVYFHDITERKRYQQKLEESNERLEQFAYAASHDLQEPLRMVSSYLQLIERRYADELDDDGQEFLEFAVDGANRMRDMIESLLKYSRVDTRGDPIEPVELDDIADDVRTDLQMRIEETDTDLTIESLPRVEGDRNQVRQVFQNLLDNAITYSGDDPPEITVSAERAGEMWELSVRDEGIGIDPDDTERVFQVFQRLHPPDKHPGTGIGLALCERIVERHGGAIWVDSTPDEGSTFTFTLPAAGESDE